MKNLFQKYPCFTWLLPFFFVLHGFTENYDFIPVKDALLLIGVYLLSSLVIYFIAWLFYKDVTKAAIFSFLIMAFHFFFGSVQDGLRKLVPGTFFTKYVFILPVSFVLFILVLILLKKRKRPLFRISYFLNVLLGLLILIDVIGLAVKIISTKNDSGALAKQFIACNDCDKPDIYLIIADEYAGSTELKDIFHFDNSEFIDQLSRRGFHTIFNSSSNYNFTPYSIASTLNMDYLDLNRTGKQPLLSYTYETIRNNQFLHFLQHYQYKFYNYSFFDFKGQPAHTRETFLPNKTRLITGQTFLSRVEKELRYHLITKFKWKNEIKEGVYFNRNNNEKLFRLSLQSAAQKITRSKFVLTHLMMPHYPYYYDKNGNEFPFEALHEGKQDNQANYIEYLQYCNKRFLELIDTILKNSSSPPIIILMGDHGFRHFNAGVDPKYYFSNLVSVHLPGKNYLSFNDSLTNVNLLRVVLNTSFKQELPYLKDTAYTMENP